MDTTHIKTIIWDLDNTLYKFSPAQVDGWNKTTALYALQNGVALTEEEAFALAEQGWLGHRNSGHFFEKDYGVDPRAMHIGVNKLLCATTATPCPQTPSLFQDMRDHRHIVLTFATTDWARRVLDHTGLAEFFEPHLVLGAEDYDFEDKAHSPRGILMALDKIGGNANETLFVEDTLPNLVTAKTHAGVCTAYLHHGRAINDNDRAHLDIIAEDTPELLTKWFKVKPEA